VLDPSAPADLPALRTSLLGRSDLVGPAQRRVLTETADAWLGRLLDAALDGAPPEGFALVAVGAYGRREPALGSDLDLVLLCAADGGRGGIAERLWYPIWDAGVGLDHAVRTVGEAVSVGRDDLKAALGLLDARHVAGNPELTAGLVSAWRAAWRSGAAARLAELREVSDARAAEAGEVAFLLEPHLKDGRGGLRDVALLDAVAVAQVSDPPGQRVREARELLLDVRGELHRRAGRGLDRLLLQEQDGVAEGLALLRPELADAGGADVLLREVSRAARVVTYAVDETWRRAEAWRNSSRRRWVTRRRGPVRRPLAAGVVEQGGEVVLARDADPGGDPGLLLRAAAAAAAAELPLSRTALSRLVAEGGAMPEPWPRQVLDSFVSLLGAGPGLVPVWESLDQAGLVDRLLPEWERVRCRPQRNAYHRFTVDRHLVETAVHAAARTRGTDRPDLLLLGALLHDLGKGWPGDHSVTGAEVVARLGPRLGLTPDDAAVLTALVRHHLLLPDTATRRDLDDPASLHLVADVCGHREVLELLGLLAAADGLATGPGAWSAWKASLVGGLVERAGHVLAGRPVPVPNGLGEAQQALADRGSLAVAVDPSGPAPTVTIAAPDRTGLLEAAAGVLALHRLDVRAATVTIRGSGAVMAFAVTPRQGAAADAGRLHDDVRRALEGSLDLSARLAQREAAYARAPGRARPAPPAVLLLDGESTGTTVVQLRAADATGVLHRACACLAACGLSVRAARVQTLGAEVVDSFYVVGPDGRELADPALRDRVRADLLAALVPTPQPA
jgi:[protein-PII] uridylyltransferase